MTQIIYMPVIYQKCKHPECDRVLDKEGQTISFQCPACGDAWDSAPLETPGYAKVSFGWIVMPIIPKGCKVIDGQVGRITSSRKEQITLMGHGRCQRNLLSGGDARRKRLIQSYQKANRRAIEMRRISFWQ